MEHLEDTARASYEAVLVTHAAVFDELGPPSTTSSTKHAIRLKNDTSIRTREYRCSEARKQLINEEVQRMLARRIIRRSTSEYSSPVVVIKKKDGSQRFCVDYRKLNEQTHVEASQLLLIADTFMKLGDAKVFSTLDLKSGYWQVPTAEESRHLTAFSTPDGYLPKTDSARVARVPTRIRENILRRCYSVFKDP